MTTTQRDIARVVKTLLTYQGKNQSDLAAHMQVKPPAISKALNNPNRQWTVDELYKLADFLDVHPMLLLEDPNSLVRGGRVTKESAATESEGEAENYLNTDRVLVAA